MTSVIGMSPIAGNPWLDGERPIDKMANEENFESIIEAARKETEPLPT